MRKEEAEGRKQKAEDESKDGLGLGQEIKNKL